MWCLGTLLFHASAILGTQHFPLKKLFLAPLLSVRGWLQTIHKGTVIYCLCLWTKVHLILACTLSWLKHNSTGWGSVNCCSPSTVRSWEHACNWRRLKNKVLNMPVSRLKKWHNCLAGGLVTWGVFSFESQIHFLSNAFISKCCWALGTCMCNF